MPVSRLKNNLDENFIILTGELETLVFSPLERTIALLDKAAGLTVPSSQPLNESDALLKALSDIDGTVFGIIAEEFLSDKIFHLKEIIKSYTAKLEKDLSGEQKHISVYQSDERLYSRAGDSGLIRSGKLFKRLAFNTRRSFNKEFRLHQHLPHWQIIRFIYRNRMQEELIPVLDSILQKSCRLHADIRMDVEESEENLLNVFLDNGNPAEEGNTEEPSSISGPEEETDPGRILAGIKDLREELHSRINELRAQLDSEYDLLMQICGTLEYPSSKLRPGKINKEFRKLVLESEKRITAWGRNHSLLYDDWRFDRNILALVLEVLEDFFKTNEVYGNRVRDRFMKFFEEQDNLGKEFVEGLKSTGLRGKQLEKDYRNLKKRASGKLIREISYVQRARLGPEILKIARNLSERAGKLNPNRSVARSFQPDKLVRDRDITEVKPVQLISAEIIPRLFSSLEEISGELTSQMEIMSGIMMQYSGIIDFGISSAVTVSYQKETKDTDIRKTIVESLSRAADKMKEVNGILDEMEKLMKVKLFEAVRNESAMLLALQDTESFLAITLKLAKARTIKGIKNQIRKLLVVFKKIGLAPVMGPVLIYRYSSREFRKLKQRIGYDVSPVKISTELSDFLSKTDSVFNELPYVYQRLYYLEPLSDEPYFVEREEVLGQMDRALRNWQEGGYSPLALVGEKGAGATTLFNVYQNRNNSVPIIRITNSEQIFEMDTFLGKLRMDMGIDAGSDLETIRDHLNNLPEPTVIVLEDLQRYYLRSVNGFSVLKRIFELISSTSQNILWMISCTSYAWKYLDKVVSVSSYFGFITLLDDMEDKDILDVIEQRHKISGFSIRYVPNKQQERSRKLMKMHDDEQQEYLELSYRSAHARFSGGNVSLALVHWIRSTREIRDKTVVISSLYEPEGGFFESLSIDKILSLYMILIHDGLAEHHLSIILNRSPESIRNILFQLFDDGILDKNNSIYLINPLIFRPAVNFLKSKNFLH